MTRVVDWRSLRSGGSIGVRFAVVDWRLGHSLISVSFADRRFVRRSDRRLDRSLSLSRCERSLSLTAFGRVFQVFWLSVFLSQLRKSFEGKTSM